MSIIILLICLELPLAAAEQPSPAPVLTKDRQTLSFCTDHYNISSQESITLYGAKDRKWLTPNLYWGEAGYGAIGGRRSGYIEGGVIAGWQLRYFRPFILELRLFLGAGGGGGAPQGGGMIIQPTAGIGFSLGGPFSALVECGYMHFLNGDISSPSIGFSLNMDYWALHWE